MTERPYIDKHRHTAAVLRHWYQSVIKSLGIRLAEDTKSTTERKRKMKNARVENYQRGYTISDQHEAADNHLVVKLSLLLVSEESRCDVCFEQSGKTVAMAHDSYPEETSLLICRGCLDSGDIDSRLERRALIMEEYARYVRGLIRHLVVPADSEWQEIVDRIDNDARDEYERQTGMAFPGGRTGDEIPF